MSNWSANLRLPYLSAAQAQKHVTHNEALERLDAIVQICVIAFDATTPPLAANEGEVWAVGLGAVNDWAGHDGSLAVWSNGGWLFIPPRTGWRAAMGSDLRVFDGTDWVPPALPALQNLPGVGVNTSYDTANPLAVSGSATLLTHAGAGHQLKINKAAVGDTGSLLFQTGWSGRAELGTSGGDDLTVKVSADGTAWTTAFSARGSDGRAGLPAGADLADGAAAAPALAFATDTGTGIFRAGASTLGLAVTGSEKLRITAGGMTVSGLVDGTAVTQTATDTTPGRLLKVGDFGLGGAAGTTAFGRANILGTVAQTGGIPTGAIIEQGSNANGTYVRFADGTQICTQHLLAGSITFAGAGTLADPYRSLAKNWTYPASFVDASVRVVGTPEFTGPLTGARRAAVFSHGASTALACQDLQLFRWIADANPDQFHINLTAIGRWF